MIFELKAFIFGFMLGLLLAFCVDTYATDIELMGPRALTLHTVTSPYARSQFANKVDKEGNLIAPYQLGIALVDNTPTHFTTRLVFMGDNSVGSKLAGAIYQHGKRYNGFELGYAAGAYLQDETEFDRRDVDSFNIGSYHHIGLVPVVGGVVNYRADIDNQVYVKINTIISPIILNAVLSVGFPW